MRYPFRHVKTVLSVVCLLLTACNPSLPAWNAGRLVIIVPETAQGAKAEFERELAQLFAEQLNARLKTVAMPHDNAAIALQRHEAHLAALSMRLASTTGTLRFGPTYQQVRELVVCNGRQSSPRSIDELSSRKLAAIAGSSQEAMLRAIQQQQPTLQWQNRRGATPRKLLAEVAGGALDCVAANELQLADANNYHTSLNVAFDIGPASELAWAFPPDADPALLEQVRIFFERIDKDGTLRRLQERYYGHHNRLDRMDAAAFIVRNETVLPHYRPLFEEAASLTGEDWRLLAALAYQESQWDPLATSRTSVRGMMMLTEDTADRMGVQNRLDARESIIAGAKYLALLKQQMPERIPEPDRTWLALAAYNQGYGHLEDARILTSRAGLNPDSWLDVKKWMPKLNQPGYYETLKRGYARGGEAVILVENIRNYHDMLKRLHPDPVAGLEPWSYHLLEPLQQLLR